MPLPIDNPAALRVALRGHVDQGELAGRLDGRSVHAHVLSWFLTAVSDEEADNLFACCERLVELGAELKDPYGDGAAAQFCGYPWPEDLDQLRQVERLADLYRAHGVWDIEQPLPGALLTRAARDDLDGDNYWGLKPLAAAIFGSNPQLAAYLLARGASFDLGSVYADEGSVHALDLAQAEGESQIQAILAQQVMESRLAQGTAPTAPLSRSPRALL